MSSIQQVAPETTHRFSSLRGATSGIPFKADILRVTRTVADGTWLCLSSANLTEYAFTINMELGTLIRGGQLPAQVEANFAALIAQGVLEPV